MEEVLCDAVTVSYVTLSQDEPTTGQDLRLMVLPLTCVVFPPTDAIVWNVQNHRENVPQCSEDWTLAEVHAPGAFCMASRGSLGAGRLWCERDRYEDQGASSRPG